MLIPVIILNSSPDIMTGTPDATRRHAELARIRLGVGDELRNCCGRNRWVHHHDVGRDNNAGDRRDVTDEMEIQFVVERRVDRLCRNDHEQRVAVSGRAHDGLGGNVGPRAGTVLDDEWLADPLRQPLTRESCDDVGCAAGRKANDDPHRPRRIGLRRSDARRGRQRGSGCGQMQKLAAGKFMLNLPSRHSITLSARNTREGGTSKPIAFAACRLIANSNLVGCSTGTSLTFSLLKTLASWRASCRNIWVMRGP